jgi:tetratricopeptide (TPR) repeat protein
MNISYRDFLNQNYFVALNDHGLKKINLKGINKISKENDPNFTEIPEKNLVPRKFEDFNLSPELIKNEEKQTIANIVKSRLEKVDIDGDVEISFTHLGAAFSVDMLDIVWIFEMASEEVRDGLEVIKDSLSFCDKGCTFDLTIESSKRYLKYLENPSDHGLLASVKKDFEDCVKEYDGNPFAHFMIGMIHHRPTVFYDLKKSIFEFTKAKEFFVEIENHYLKALTNFILAWLYYIDSDTDRAIELSLEAIDEEFMNIPEIYYNLSKYYASKDDSENSIKYLDEAIRRFDFFYSIKADIDDDFNNIKSELIKYFIKLKEEEKSKIMLKLSEMGISFVADKKEPLKNQAAIDA